MHKLILIPTFITSICGLGLAQDKTLEIKYNAYFLGLPIGEGTVNSSFKGANYTTTINARTKGVGAFAPGWANLKGSGTIDATRANGTSYGFESKGKQGLTNFSMALAKNTVISLKKDPDRPPNGPIMPLTEAHKRGIIDPLSATIIVLGANENPFSESACAKTFPIFDGWLRFDMSFTYNGIEEISTQAYKGKAVKCRVNLNFIAGYRTDKPIAKENEKVPLHIWLIPLQQTKWLIPYKIEINTKYGKARIEAQTIDF